MTEIPYNPLDKKHLGESIATALLVQPASPLEDLPRRNFVGAGVYAIYYRGDFEPYELLSKANTDDFEIPIYVGKAVPEGSRTGFEVLAGDLTTNLCERMKEHRRSVRQAENISETHFWCRWIVVESIWIPLGEAVMIDRFKPLWNSRILDGFGNHTPGSGRIEGARSRWDTLHPGRSWAPRYPARTETPAQIAADAIGYLRERIGH
jgi:hypothetical protein